jgi:16S rRNA (guanine527-N7)-methyltransferase
MGACLPAGVERLLDLGSGGGVPGLVLAESAPDLRLVLVDSAMRRGRFLREATVELGMEVRVEVVEERAETAARHPSLREAFDAVVARSFGLPGVTAECAVGFLRLGGSLVVSEPPEASVRWPPDALADLGLGPAEGCGTGEFSFVRLEKVRLDDRWPRRVGIPAKRPRF